MEKDLQDALLNGVFALQAQVEAQDALIDALIATMSITSPNSLETLRAQILQRSSYSKDSLGPEHLPVFQDLIAQKLRGIDALQGR